MKKTLKRIVCTALSFVCAAGAASMAGCGKKDADDPNTLVIDAFEGGYGIKWLQEIADRFEEKNEGVTVKVYGTQDDSVFSEHLMSGRLTSDIVFERYPFWERVMRPTTIGNTTYDCLLEDLTDIYTSKIPGEDVTVEEKLIDEVADYYKTDGKYYHFNWAVGPMGILYNEKQWKTGWKIPRTTDELIELCDTIKADKKIPFVYSLKNTYWGFYDVWAAQYEGLEAMNDYDDGYDPNGERYTPELVLYKGFEEALKVLETLLKNENGYMHLSSQEYTFTEAQIKFLEGEAVMQPNGDWIESEMSANFSEDEVTIQFIKTPVISSIVDKCPSITGTAEEKQEKLEAVIDYVDEVENARIPEGVSDEDVERIRTARSLLHVTGQDHTAYVPVYSKKKDLAKRFLQFMATDEAIELYVKASGGYRTMFRYDYDKPEIQNAMSSFMKSANELVENSRLFFLKHKDPIFSLTGMVFMRNGITGTPESYLSAVNSKDYLSASEIYQKNYTSLKSQWKNYLASANIVK